MLGIREPDIYGKKSYADLVEYIGEICPGAEVIQSNHEGAIIDAIHGAFGRFDAIVINPAAYTHTSIAIADAIKAVGIPAVEVHLTDISSREDFRKVSYVSGVCEKTFMGGGFDSYKDALLYLKGRFADAD